MATVSIQKALSLVAANPVPSTDNMLDLKAHELIASTLIEIANSPDSKVRGSMARATRAQRLLLNRLVGLRRPGSHPAARETTGITFVDLTSGAIE